MGRAASRGQITNRPSSLDAAVAYLDIISDMPPPKTALYVRIPTATAEKLDQAAFQLKRPKQDLIAGLVSAADIDTLRRVTVETTDDGLTIGHAAFRPHPTPPDVLTIADLAQWLSVEEATVAELAEKGELPGRRLGGEWRFARDAVLDWLARR
jgi:excisionase family DNA binding protein